MNSPSDKYRYFHLPIAEMEKDHMSSKLDQRCFKYVAFVRLNASGETIYMPPK